MARINIEECWWSDLRRSKLSRLLGSEDLADAAAIRMWRMAQEFWARERSVIPFKVWETLEAGPKLIEARLAEERPDGVYVSGSSQYHDWMFDRREAGRAGGKKSAKVRLAKNGTAQPKVPENAANPEANAKQIQPSYSSSYSSSGSKEVVVVATATNSTLNFDERMKSQDWVSFLKEADLDTAMFKNNLPLLKERFKTIDYFKEWITSVCKNKRYQELKAANQRVDCDRYLESSIKKEIGIGVA